jgi:transposase
MIEFKGMKIFFYAKKIDMRKGIDGLCFLLVDQEIKPQTGDLYLFSNRTGRTVKGLIWDRNGFILVCKRIERGRFKIRYDDSKNAPLELTEEQLRWLLAGLDFEKLILFPELNIKDFC